jgi:hypothetical protein
MLQVYPKNFTAEQADRMSLGDVTSNKIWLTIQHTIALVSPPGRLH